MGRCPRSPLAFVLVDKAPCYSRALCHGKALCSRTLCAALLLAQLGAATGCALLIPSSWRGRAPVALAGPIDTTGAGAESEVDASALTDAELAARIDADESRLVEIASRPPQDKEAETDPAELAELREIAGRLPQLQRELARRRGDGDDAIRIIR